MENTNDEDPAIYADLGIGGQPDNMNPGSEEASDTILYTDNMTARNATDNVSNSFDDELPEEERLLDEEMDRLNDGDVERENEDTDR